MVIVLLVLWPLFVAPEIYEQVVCRLTVRPKPDFKILRRDLGRALSIEAVEANSPLNPHPACLKCSDDVQNEI